MDKYSETSRGRILNWKVDQLQQEELKDTKVQNQVN